MTENASSGERQFTWSDTWPARLGKSLLSALLLPGDVYAGRVTPNDPEYYERAADLAGFTSLSTLASPRGALGAGAVRPRKSLPMDVESRMQRARDLGFDTDRQVYHGTSGPDFRSFDPSKGGTTTGTAPARQGIWSAFDPEIGNFFAEIAARNKGGNPRVMPLLHRSERQGMIRLNGSELGHEIAATLAKAWDDGFDSVMLKNHLPVGGKSGDTLVVRNPAQLRSTQAAFDPARRNSSDLLAGIAGLGLGGTLLSNEGPWKGGAAP